MVAKVNEYKELLKEKEELGDDLDEDLEDELDEGLKLDGIVIRNISEKIKKEIGRKSKADSNREHSQAKVFILRQLQAGILGQSSTA